MHVHARCHDFSERPDVGVVQLCVTVGHPWFRASLSVCRTVGAMIIVFLSSCYKHDEPLTGTDSHSADGRHIRVSGKIGQSLDTPTLPFL